MAKQWIKQQVKRNELQEYVDRGALWALGNRQTVLMAAGGVLAVLVIAGMFLYKNSSGQTAAWDRLSVAQGYAYGGQADASLEQIKGLETEHTGAKASGFGQLFAGDIYFQRGSYKETTETYSKILERGEPRALVPYALSGTALAQESAGQCGESAATSQKFLDTYSDHLLAPQVHASLARCLNNLGQTDQAKTTYQKITLQYPDTYWARWAQARLSAP